MCTLEAVRGRRRGGIGVRAGVLLVLLALAAGCSLQKILVRRLGRALSTGVSSWGTDDDPEFVGEAVPFALKLIETLVAQSPEDRDLLAAACSGFTQYAYVWLECESDFIREDDLQRSTALRERAARMYRRALEYGLRGIEADHPGFRNRLREDAEAALASFEKRDVPRLYWTAGAWASAIGLSLSDVGFAADLPLAEAMMRRALALDESFGLGSIHDFFVAYDGGRSGAAGGSVERARASFDRALAIARGRRASSYVTFAETVDVGLQDRKEFEKHLREALAVDPDAVPEQRLANLVAQRRARWLLSRADALFIE